MEQELKKEAQPSWISPMLATLTKQYFSDPAWLYEHKFDGERCLAFKKNGTVTLMSRNKKNINREYPEIVTALEKQVADNFIIDGEIVACSRKGISDFELLQGRINLSRESTIAQKIKNIRISYCIFDLLYYSPYNICALQLYKRKALLEQLLEYNKLLVYTTHVIGTGLAYFKKACSWGWEGIIAKKIDSAYTGRRSSDWLKFKCIMKQELVIGGYTNPRKSRLFFGALLVGYYKDNLFTFAGKVGTGFSHDTLELLGRKLQKIGVKKCPFFHYDGPQTNVHWVKPLLVAEFEFAEWTQAHKLRVGRYKGLRNDKNPRDVIQEIPRNS